MTSNSSAKAFSILVAAVLLCLTIFWYGSREDTKSTLRQTGYQPFDRAHYEQSLMREEKERDSPMSIPNSYSAVQTPRNKTILSIDEGGPWLTQRIRFQGCEYSNCDLIYSQDNIGDALQADAIIFFQRSKYSLLKFPPEVRQRQLWFALSMESPSYSWNRYYPIVNSFNGSMTYAQTSVPDQFPYGRTENKTTKSTGHINYAKNKTKGAYAYVSHCYSREYNRLELMTQLKKYINVDIFGACTKKTPCSAKPTINLTCEAKAHSRYRFYLAFENSLCMDYITEKFWKTLASEGNFIPVALGGLSVQEYTDIAPPDSFIHVYNFSSIETLGKYLQHLMTDDTAYNRYHLWRSNYSVKRSMKPACDLCKAVNKPEAIQSEQGRQFADEWSYENNCRNLTLPPL